MQVDKFPRVGSFFLAFVDGFLAPIIVSSLFFLLETLASFLLLFFSLFLLETGARSISSCIELLVGGSIGILGSISELALHLCFVALIAG
jgi:hypothetical protein